MEFWGVEVKAGTPLKVQPEIGKLIHISQAALGEVKDPKAAKYVPLKLKIDSKNFVIGALSAEDRPQIMFDLVFEKEFEISHDWKNGCVYFIGYTADEPVSDDEGFSDFDDVSEDEAEPVDIPENGKPKVEDVKAAKGPAAKAAKGAVAAKPAVKNNAEEDDDSESDDEMLSGDDSDDSDESLSGEEEEETPKAQQQSKKRPAEPAQKTPVQAAKKAKASTPDDSGNKRGHNATPFPNKGGNKSNGQGPKSGGFNKGQSPKSGGFNKGQSGGFNNKGQSGGFNKGQSPKSGGFNKGHSPKSGGFRGGKRGGK